MSLVEDFVEKPLINKDKNYDKNKERRTYLLPRMMTAKYM